MASITLPAEFGFVVVVAAVIAFQVVLHGGIYVGAARRKVFTKEYYQQQSVKDLAEVHKKEFKADQLPQGGYPDVGSGRYSALLSYRDWFTFNIAQRAHLNYVEGVASALVLVLLSGLFFPRFSALTGIVYIVGRELYSFEYSRRGPGSRIYGAILFDVALIVLLGATITGGVQLALPALSNPDLFKVSF